MSIPSKMGWSDPAPITSSNEVYIVVREKYMVTIKYVRKSKLNEKKKITK